MQVQTIEELVRHLKDFRTWGNQGEGYDAVGALHLLGACLDNLRLNASKSDLAELPECLEPHQLMFLQKLAVGVR
jgi:hypothetical protein